MLDIKYKCECGYIGTADWVKSITEADGGHWEKEYRGCPKCKKPTSKMKALEVIEGDDDNSK